MQSTRLLVTAALAAFAPVGLLAVDYTRTITSGTTTWSNTALWSPVGTPNHSSDNVAFSLDSTGTVQVDGAYTVHNLSVTAGSGGRTLTFSAPAINATHSLTVLGTLSKSNNTTNLNFENEAGAGHLLNVSIGKLDLATNGGTASFGRANGSRWLNNLTLGELVLGGGGSSAITVNLNVAHNYSLGAVTFNAGNNQKDVYLINNGIASGTGYARTATVTGITDNRVVGTHAAATIHGSKVAAAAGGSNAATLRIDTAADESYSAATILADGIGGTLAVIKTGAGTQFLTGASTYTGGTTVENGALVVSGSLAASGDIAISSGGTFVAAAALSAHDLRLDSGALLGFNLGANGSLTLGGDVIKTGEGPATFVVDFRNTGVVGQSYEGLLSIAGTSDFAPETTLSFINFSAEGINGTFTYGELVNGFTIAAIPEPSSFAVLAGLATLAACAAIRRRR